MTVNGVGSWSSPIVISDSDDSEAFVELELERRISSPRDGMDVDYEDYRDSYGWPETREQEYAYNEEPRWDDPPDPPFQEHGRKPLSSHKRKRSESPSPPNGRTGSFAPPPPPVKARPLSPNAPFGESKTARKKRKKREKLAATGSMPQPVAGPSSVVPPLQSAPVHAPPHYLPLPHIPFMQFGVPHALPQKPAPAFPLFAMEAASMMMAHQMMPPMLPMPPPQFEPMDGLATPPLIYPSIEEIEEGFVGASEIPRPKPVAKKPIGMAPDADPASRHGTYKSPNPQFAPPNPARTLVMELLPKKFRNLAFVRSWAARFTRGGGAPRVDLDIKIGKSLIEFPTADMARTAWDSDRMLGEGKEHIRVWWYRVPGVGADAGVGVLEEGEVEDGELDKSSGKKHKQKKKAKEEPPPVAVPPPSSPTNFRPPSGQTSPVIPSSKPSSPVQRRFSVSSGFASLPPKPLARSTGDYNASTSRSRQPSTQQSEFSSPTTSTLDPSSRSFVPAFLAHTLHHEPRDTILSTSPSSFITTTPDVATKTSQSSAVDNSTASGLVRSELELAVAPPPTRQDLDVTVVHMATSDLTAIISPRTHTNGLVLPTALITDDSSLAARPSAQSPLKSAQPLPIPFPVSDGLINPTLPPTSSSLPEQSEDMPPYRTRDDQKRELLARMARAKEEIEARTSSSSGSSRNITPVSEVEPSVENGQVAICAETLSVPQVPPPPPPPTAPVPSNPASQEQELRREVLKSMKNKVLPKPTAVSSTKMSLDDLATSFIVDTIQAAVVTEFTMPVTNPAMLAVSSRIFVGQREVCQDARRPLEPIRDMHKYNFLKSEMLMRTLERQRKLISQLDGAQKSGRKEILDQLKAVERLHAEELGELDERLALGKRMEREWPSTAPEDCIIDISDDESDPEDYEDENNMMV